MSLESWIVCGRCKGILSTHTAKEWRVVVFGREMGGYACAPCAAQTFLKTPAAAKVPAKTCPTVRAKKGKRK